MSFNNIDNPTAIQAILDQLRSSEAWQQALHPNGGGTQAIPAADSSSSSEPVGSNTYANIPTHGLTSNSDHNTSPPLAGTSASSVASLLSQLRAASEFSSSGSFPAAPGPGHDFVYQADTIVKSHPPLTSSSTSLTSRDLIHTTPDTFTTKSNAPQATSSAPPISPAQNLRSCSFQQALPYIAQLSSNSQFVQSLHSMKDEQLQLEKRLSEERRAVQRKHEDKVQVARTKATMIGAGLTQYEADTIMEGFRKELVKFDLERVLPAWDGLVAKQQAALEALGVPTMFPSTDGRDRERQQRVMQVLSGVTE